MNQDEIIDIAIKAGLSVQEDTRQIYIEFGNGFGRVDITEKVTKLVELIIASLAQPKTVNDLLIAAGIDPTKADFKEILSVIEPQPTPSQSEPAARFVKDSNSCAIITLSNIEDGALLYTKPQPTSQDAERLRYLHSYYSATGQIVDTSYDDWIANIDAMKESK